MSIRGRIRGLRRRTPVREAVQADLREFVYLDDTSVHSLYASRLGEIVAERTETKASKVQSEILSNLGAGVHLVKAELGSKIQAESSEGTQVMRKAVIQSTFKELRDLELQSLVLRSPSSVSAECPRTIAELMRKPAGLLIDPALLSRGALVELEVQLEAEPIFRVGTVLSSLLDVLQDNPSMLPTQNLNELRTGQRMMDKLLTNLVPVRGRAIDYSVVVLDGKEWVIHRQALEEVEWGETPKAVLPLYLVGVAEKPLFWKDIRRVVFAGSSYRVFARVARAGTSSSWTPVKLVDVVRTFVPDFESTIESISHGLVPGLQAEPSSTAGTTRRVRYALEAFALALADHVGCELAPEDIESYCFSVQTLEQFTTVVDQRKRFAEVQQFVEERLGVTIDRVTAAKCRTEAIITAGFDPDGRDRRPASPTDLQGPKADRYLDTEIVAIYW